MRRGKQGISKKSARRDRRGGNCSAAPATDDVALLENVPLRAYFEENFRKKCGRDEGLAGKGR